MILDGERLTKALYGEVVDPRDHLVRMYADTPGIDARIPPLGHVVATAPPLEARVNHGVWKAACPCGATRGIPTPGGVVFFGTPLVFCLRCGNQGTGHGWRPVTVPDEATRHRIEAILLCRPRVEDRNWEPGETVDDLIRQNREHGDPLPDLPVGVEIGAVHGPDWRDLVAPFGGRLVAELGPRWWRRLLGRR